MYRLATKQIHLVTDGQADRQTDDSVMPIDDHIACSSTIC